MPNYYAKNIRWSPLGADNTTEAVFDVYDSNEALLASDVVAKGAPADIQVHIADALKAKATALAVYAAITENAELIVAMD